MLKKTITYTDYDGNERKEDFYFNLTKAELTKMELGTTGGLEKTINNIIAAQDTPRVVELFEKIVLSAYGEKTADGRGFRKSEELSKAFTETEAYSELFMELITDAKAASDFINGIIPKEIAQQAAAMQANQNHPANKK